MGEPVYMFTLFDYSTVLIVLHSFILFVSIHYFLVTRPAMDHPHRCNCSVFEPDLSSPRLLVSIRLLYDAGSLPVVRSFGISESTPSTCQGQLTACDAQQLS